MKKMNNKGFSLVELIIVIAIMAILAAAIAPALIRYIDKSRKANDVTAAGTIATAVEAALANEDAYDEVVKGTGTTLVVKIDGSGYSAAGNVFKTEVSDNLSTVPKIKYKKNGATTFSVAVGGKGELYVYIGDNANISKWQIQPSMTAEYK